MQLINMSMRNIGIMIRNKEYIWIPKICFEFTGWMLIQKLPVNFKIYNMMYSRDAIL